ncbi:MAG TPA: TRIC cation channel family protein [Chitinophagaceae bacterium]|nr:TRIC cation channel family protein [Chitinophagaceae bacterium]
MAQYAFLFDAIGLGLFTVVGLTKSMEAGLSFWVCIVMGTITGSLGGVIRDVLLNEVPLLLRKDIYALACVAGGVVYVVCEHFSFSSVLTEILAVATVIVIRVIALRFGIHLPVLKLVDANAPKKEN